MPLKPGTDTVYIRKLMKAACESQDNPDSAIQLSELTLKLSIDGGFYNGIMESLCLMAKCYNNKSDYANCLLANRRMLAYPQKHSSRATTYLNIGVTYSYQGDYTAATANFDSGVSELQMAPEEDVPRTYFILYNSLGAINVRFKQDSLALYYYNKAEDVARKSNFRHFLVVVLSNKAAYFQDHKRLDSAILLMTEAKQVVAKYDLKVDESDVDQSIGSIYLDSGKYEMAIGYLRSSLLPEKLKYTQGPEVTELGSSYLLAKALYHLGKYKEAENIIVPAIRKASELNIRESILEAYETLTDIYKATGQYKKVVDCYDTLAVLREEKTGVEKANAINQLQAKFQSAEKDKLLSQNQLMLAQQKNKIAHKNVWILSIASVVLLLLLIFVWVYLRARSEQKILANEHKIEVLKAAVEGSDNERSRIARELHDGVGGMLSAVMMRFSSMHHENPAIIETTAYKDSIAILAEMGDEIRKTAHNLMPEVLLKQTLPEAVRIFCNNAQEGHDFKINFQSYGDFSDMSQGHKLNLYRIVQELIKNTIMHAKATTVMVQLLRNDDKLVVSVEDNGVGFNVNEINAGLGLYNLRTRVSSMDGHLTIESKPGKGTSIIIEFEHYEINKQIGINENESTSRRA